jgi:thiol peroxidase
MSEITLKGSPVNIIGELPYAGSRAPDFILTKTDLSDVTLDNFAGKPLAMNIFPSLDTSVCAATVRRFNAEAAKLDNVNVICVSLDLPFAHMRFCESEGIKNVLNLSELRNRDFGNRYGIRMTNGPLAGLLARSIVLVDSQVNIAYTQLVPEITQEPNYDEALAFIKKMK